MSDDLTLDTIDRQLIDLLRTNARAPVASLARAVGRSRSAVQERLAALERAGVIRGYTVVLADAVSKPAIEAQVLLSVSPKQTARVVASLRRMPAVRSLHAVSGAHDMVALVAADTTAAMDAALDDIGAVPGIERTTSSIILSEKFSR